MFWIKNLVKNLTIHEFNEDSFNDLFSLMIIIKIIIHQIKKMMIMIMNMNHKKNYKLIKK